LVTLFAAFLILLCVTAEDVFGHAPFAKVARLGELTYSTYLIHFPIQIILASIVDEAGLSRQVFRQPGALVLYLALTFSLGQLVYRRFEVPAQRFIRARMIPEPLPAPQMWSARP
jgi:peptidoglycan/LPS O-acetylase OafA/YrhL